MISRLIFFFLLDFLNSRAVAAPVLQNFDDV